MDCSTNNQKAEQIKPFYSTTLPLGAKKLINLTNLKIKPFVVKTFRLNEKMYLLPLSNKKIRFLLINCNKKNIRGEKNYNYFAINQVYVFCAVGNFNVNSLCIKVFNFLLMLSWVRRIIDIS